MLTIFMKSIVGTGLHLVLPFQTGQDSRTEESRLWER